MERSNKRLRELKARFNDLIKQSAWVTTDGITNEDLLVVLDWYDEGRNSEQKGYIKKAERAEVLMALDLIKKKRGIKAFNSYERMPDLHNIYYPYVNINLDYELEEQKYTFENFFNN